jgi:DNA polymerase-3 subunit gamma/tau
VSYQVLARRWRPQRFEDVVGQQAVTTTLRNALTTGRLAHAFIFAGARGVGKTTTARILARCLNCVKGPTPDPCGVCDACVEIAEGRDIDVFEIDAATHTGIDNIREVIISTLAMSPVRDRYKVFIIDEVHQLSGPSFNALLKSIEEPPAHVVFILATTELQKIPDTIRSRSQEYEFRTIGTAAIAGQLRTIADAEKIQATDDAIALLARYAEGSMRDAESAFDQVISFAGGEVTADAVAEVLGLVGRDLLFDILTAVADEDAAQAFALAGRAVEAGYDLRILCREIAALVRAMMLVSIDPSRLTDPDLVFESDRDRLKALTARYSREDLLRSFDLLAKAEQDVRAASQPRYALEMALVKWIHLRKLVPISELIAGLERGGGSSLAPAPRPQPSSPARPAPSGGFGARPAFGARPPSTSASGAGPAAQTGRPGPAGLSGQAGQSGPAGQAGGSGLAGQAGPAGQSGQAGPAGPLPADFKERFLAEIQRTNRTFYSLHVAQAQRIEVDARRVVFTFGPVHETMRQQVEQRRQWLESLAESVAGGKVTVATAKGTGDATPEPRPAASPAPVAPAFAAGAAATGNPGAADAASAEQPDLRARALADDGVQAMLEIFPAEIREVEEIK